MALGVQISSFVFVGFPTLAAVFGAYTAPSSVQIQRLQITAQTGPLGGNIQVTLINAAGVSLGATVTLGAGTTYYDQPLAAPITLAPGAIVRAMITGVDNGTASDIVVNLIGATAQGTPTPSGCATHECAPPVGTLLFFQGSVLQELEAAQAAEAAAAASAVIATAKAAAALQSAQNASNSEASAVIAAGLANTAQVQATAFATNANNAATAASNYSNAAQASANAAAASAAATRPCASLRLSAGSTHTLNTGAATVVSWDSVLFDDKVFWSGTNPSRLTVPDGVTRVRLSAGIRWTPNATGERQLQIRGNPAGIYEANSIWASDDRPSDVSGDATATTPIIPVVAGDYFEVVVTQNGAATLDLLTTAAANHANFFTIETVKS